MPLRIGRGQFVLGVGIRDELAEVLLRVSRLVEAVPQISELDVNPLILGTERAGTSVVDVRVRLVREPVDHPEGVTQ